MEPSNLQKMGIMIRFQISEWFLWFDDENVASCVRSLSSNITGYFAEFKWICFLAPSCLRMIYIVQIITCHLCSRLASGRCLYMHSDFLLIAVVNIFLPVSNPVRYAYFLASLLSAYGFLAGHGVTVLYHLKYWHTCKCSKARIKLLFSLPPLCCRSVFISGEYP